MKIDYTIAMGTIIHLVVLVNVLWLMSYAFGRRLREIETKQDTLLRRLNGESRCKSNQQ
jgi:hypothetical protein